MMSVVEAKAFSSASEYVNSVTGYVGNFFGTSFQCGICSSSAYMYMKKKIFLRKFPYWKLYIILISLLILINSIKISTMNKSKN